MNKELIEDSNSPLEKYSILVASSELVKMGMIEILESDPSYEVIGSTELSEIMTQVNRAYLDLIIIQSDLPNLELTSLSIQVRSHDPDVQILVMSLEMDNAREVGIWRSGVDDVILYPTSVAHVKYRVARALKMRRLSRVNNELSSKNSELWKFAAIDGLTKLLNRKYFNIRFSAEFSRVQRFGGALGCILVDIDNFNDVNNKHGHAMGDHILLKVAQLLSYALRRIDTVSRYGGGEFMIMMPETVCDQLYFVSDRIRSLIEQYDFCVTDEGERIAGPQNVTVSIGISSYPNSSINDPKQMIALVETALSNAKRKGLNSIVVG